MTARAIPALQIRHGDGDEWRVAVTWPDGQVEDVASFKTEADANEWIAKEFQGWLEKRNAQTGPRR